MIIAMNYNGDKACSPFKEFEYESTDDCLVSFRASYWFLRQKWEEWRYGYFQILDNGTIVFSREIPCVCFDISEVSLSCVSREESGVPASAGIVLVVNCMLEAKASSFRCIVQLGELEKLSVAIADNSSVNNVDAFMQRQRVSSLLTGIVSDMELHLGVYETPQAYLASFYVYGWIANGWKKWKPRFLQVRSDGTIAFKQHKHLLDDVVLDLVGVHVTCSAIDVDHNNGNVGMLPPTTKCSSSNDEIDAAAGNMVVLGLDWGKKSVKIRYMVAAKEGDLIREAISTVTCTVDNVLTAAEHTGGHTHVTTVVPV